MNSFDFSNNPEAERAIECIKNTDTSVFLTGKAGTGKSTLLKHIISKINKKYILLAPTGISALQIGGQTIHSFFGFGLQPFLPDDQNIPNMLERQELLEKLDLIIIDEISMVRSDIMNMIDKTLQKNLDSPLPFGWKQILLVGDLLQLPPVIGKWNGSEAKILRANYETEFFFSAPVFDTFDLEFIELKKVYRQKEPGFVKILNNIRINQVNDADILKINTRHRVPLKNNNSITLATTNSTVDGINADKLSQIDAKQYQFRAKKTGTFRSNKNNTYPTDDILSLKVWAQIIFIKNDPEWKYVNGSIGHIVSLTKETIKVSIDGYTLPIFLHTWDDINYFWDKENNRIQKETIGSFSQFPIRLAWAITIHKSQWQTFDSCVIDMSTGAFTFGQTYVALSRCTSFSGISLSKKITKSDIKISDAVVQYLSEQWSRSIQERESIECELIEQIEASKQRIKELREILSQRESTIFQRNEEIKDLQKQLEEKTYLKDLEIEKLKIKITFLEKELERVKNITWIQKLFNVQ